MTASIDRKPHRRKRLRSLWRRAEFWCAVVLLLTTSVSSACLCREDSLHHAFERTPYVFVAQVTKVDEATEEQKREGFHSVGHFDLIDSFKEDPPFDSVRTLGGKACGYALEAGRTYLIFTGRSQTVRGCAQSMRIEDENYRDNNAVRAIEAYLFGQTPTIREPWRFKKRAHNASRYRCELVRRNFLPNSNQFLQSIKLSTIAGTMAEITRAMQPEASVSFGSRDNLQQNIAEAWVGASAVAFDRTNRSDRAFTLQGEQAMATSRKILAGESLTFDSVMLEELRSIGGVQRGTREPSAHVIEFDLSNLGSAGKMFAACLDDFAFTGPEVDADSGRPRRVNN